MGRQIGLFEITFWNASVRVSLQEFLVTWHSWCNRCVLEMWEPPPLPAARLSASPQELGIHTLAELWGRYLRPCSILPLNGTLVP